jgi:hypothetical protein
MCAQAALGEAEAKVADFTALLEKQRDKSKHFDADQAAAVAAVEAADKERQQVRMCV